MSTCANCADAAAYNYVGITYCKKHLPRFLRTKNGVSPLVRVLDVTPADATWVPPTATAYVPPAKPVEDVQGIVTDPIEEEQPPAPKPVAPKTTSKAKAKPAPKEVTPKDE